MGDIQLGFDVNSLIVLNATYGSEFSETLHRNDHRTLTGDLFTYIEPNGFTSYKMPETFVNSANRSLVNSWWKTGADLSLILNSDFPSSIETVRIVSKKEPYTKFIRPYFQILYAGDLILETI